MAAPEFPSGIYLAMSLATLQQMQLAGSLASEAGDQRADGSQWTAWQVGQWSRLARQKQRSPDAVDGTPGRTEEGTS